MNIRKIAAMRLMLCIALLSPATALRAQSPDRVRTLVFDAGEAGSRFYRIPALAVAADGSIVALADKRGASSRDLPNTISVVSKRSTDGGRTWSEAVTVAQGDSAAGRTFGDPAIVLDRRTGNLVSVFSGDTGFFYSTPEKPARFYVAISSDNGQSWSEPRPILEDMYAKGWHGGFAASGHILQARDGRLMFVANTRTSAKRDNTDVYEFLCVSSDGGLTWHVANPDARIPADGKGNESMVAELADGTLLMSIRSRGARRFSLSTDGGSTWTAAEVVPELVEPDCNGDIIALEHTPGVLLHSIPNNATDRRDVAIFASFDQGKTWPAKTLVSPGDAMYSSLAELPDGRIGCFVEEWNPEIKAFQLYFISLPVSELTNQKK